MHRQEPSKLSEHWSNTLMHWVQSLRSRGFRQNEIISEVNAWKEENGPFRSLEKRHPPTPKDIMKVFGDADELLDPLDERRSLARERALDRTWNERREDSIRKDIRIAKDPKEPKSARGVSTLSRRDGNASRDPYQEPPPKSYTCNRCGEKGMPRSLRGRLHLLQVKLALPLPLVFSSPAGAGYLSTLCMLITTRTSPSSLPHKHGSILRQTTRQLLRLHMLPSQRRALPIPVSQKHRPKLHLPETKISRHPNTQKRPL